MKTIKAVALIVAVSGVFASASCSTTKGFGQDLQKVGERVERRAHATGGTR